MTFTAQLCVLCVLVYIYIYIIFFFFFFFSQRNAWILLVEFPYTLYAHSLFHDLLYLIQPPALLVELRILQLNPPLMSTNLQTFKECPSYDTKTTSGGKSTVQELWKVLSHPFIAITLRYTLYVSTYYGPVYRWNRFVGKLFISIGILGTI